jgi:hypothetical protein
MKIITTFYRCDFCWKRANRHSLPKSWKEATDCSGKEVHSCNRDTCMEKFTKLVEEQELKQKQSEVKQ